MQVRTLQLPVRLLLPFATSVPQVLTPRLVGRPQAPRAKTARRVRTLLALVHLCVRVVLQVRTLLALVRRLRPPA
jgi:hypothetical protein